VDGRRIRTLVDDTREAGEYQIAWDGRAEGGEPAAAGVYYARLLAGSRSFARPIVRLK
jgi:hypothetical protein